MVSVLLVGWVSCKHDSYDSKLLTRAESLAIRQPVVAMATLDSIQFPELLGKNKYLKYLIRMTQVRFLMGQNVSEDSLILDASTYFKQAKDWQYSSLADFRSACIYADLKKPDQAILYLKSAAYLADKTGNPALQGMISMRLGDHWIECSEFKEAIKNLHATIGFYHRAGMEYPSSAKAYTQLAKAFSMIENRDSALFYGYQACELAKKHKDVEGEALAMQGIGDLEWHSGHYDQAEKAYLKALAVSGSPVNKVRSFVNLAILNYEQEKSGPVKNYVHQLESNINLVRDPYLLVSTYQFLKEWYKEVGDQKKAAEADNHFNTFLTDIISEKKATLDWKESNKIVHLRQSYLDSRMSGQMRTWALVFSCLILLVIVLLILRQNRRHRAALLEAKSNITTLQSMASDYQEKEDNLRQLALKHFNVLKRVALLDGMMKDLKSGQEQKIYNLFNQAVYENKLGFDWDTFFQSINQLKNGMPEKVRKNYPQLTETEYRILILSFTGLSNKETSIILNLSVNTINSLRTSIRRKLNVPEYGDLEIFVTNQF